MSHRSQRSWKPAFVESQIIKGNKPPESQFASRATTGTVDYWLGVVYDSVLATRTRAGRSLTSPGQGPSRPEGDPNPGFYSNANPEVDANVKEDPNAAARPKGF